MGAAASYDVKPQELAEFRKLTVTGAIEEYDIPQRIQNRKPTNKKYLLVMGIFLLLLMPFLIYGFIFSDIRRLSLRYDNCGNLCGYNNTKDKSVACSGQPFANKPYLQYKQIPDKNPEKWIVERRECVSDCNDFVYKVVNNHFCIPKSPDDRNKDAKEINIYSLIDVAIVSLKLSWWRIILAVLISIAIAVAALGLFRFAVACVVWSILIGTILLCSLLCLVFVYVGVDIGNHPSKYTSELETKKDLASLKTFVFIFAAVFGFLALIFTLILICLRKRVRLIIQLMKEATKGIFACPAVLTIPVVTSIIVKILIVSLIVGCLALSTTSSLELIKEDFYFFNNKPIAKFIIAFNVVAVLWLVQFVIGCQYMMIAGALSTWYFNKKKQYLSPVWQSVYITFRFHLGTVAVGSLIVTLVALIRAIIRSLAKGKIAKAVIDCCLRGVEQFLQYLTKNAYIMTAIHGQSFYRSGKRAAKLLAANFIDVVALNSVGDYVIGITSFLVVIITTVVSYTLFMSLDASMIAAPMVLVFILNCFVVSCVFDLLTTAIDTIFLCFCEDCNLNDGMARPYCMSTGMMQFMNDSKTILGEKKTSY